MQIKLKPCPDCGCKKIYTCKTVFPKKFKKWYLECKHCHYCGKSAVFRFLAKIKWNRRADNENHQET